MTYKISTGELRDANGTLLGVGYSGNTTGLNNPAADDEHAVGPLPEGDYTVGAAETYPHLGPLAMALTPDESNEMFGRSGFFIHGDNAEMNHTGSDGCIVMAHAIRELIAASADRSLTVIA